MIATKETRLNVSFVLSSPRAARHRPAPLRFASWRATPASQMRAQRRLATALVSILILSVAGRVAVFRWGSWLAVPSIVAFVAVLIVFTIMEARARRVRATEHFKQNLKRMGRLPK
jgi:cell division protein FtsW (lipid II flippase)